MMSNHTPGPWTYQEKSDDYTHIVRGPRNLFLVQLAQDSTGTAEADARLIAAAPDLLSALEAINDWCGSGDGAHALPYEPSWAEQMRAAIAKATGEPG